MLSTPEKKVLEHYLDILADLTKEAAGIQAKIRRTEVSVRSILALQDDEEIMPYMERLDDIIQPSGFTHAVKKVFRSNPKTTMTPAEVKDHLPKVGFDTNGYTNVLASVQTTLKRLAKLGLEIEAVQKDGKTAYRAVTFDDRLLRRMVIKVIKKD